MNELSINNISHGSRLNNEKPRHSSQWRSLQQTYVLKTLHKKILVQTHSVGTHQTLLCTHILCSEHKYSGKCCDVPPMTSHPRNKSDSILVFVFYYVVTSTRLWNLTSPRTQLKLRKSGWGIQHLALSSLRHRSLCTR